MDTRIGTSVLATALLTLGAGLPAPTAAQSTLLPWVGCWEAAGAPADAALCVRPVEGTASVEVLRIEGSQILSREMVWADGQRHETVREGCDGWEEGRFSADGRRLFLTSEHVCEDGSVRSGAGVMALVDEDVWLDVRTLSLGDEPSAWVQRYQRSTSDAEALAGVADYLDERAMMARASRVAASARLDLDDVLEASELLPEEAVEAWLAETGDEFELDGRTLVALDDAGVPDRVIDVVVAVSHPRTFRLGADGQAAVVDDAQGVRTRSAYGGYYGSPFFFDDLYYRSYRYSPYYGGYGYGGYYGSGYYGYGYRPTIVVVEPRDNGNHGRVVNGRGYTRPSGRSGASYPSSIGSSPRSGGSTASPSRGGSSGSSGSARKAKRRGGKESGR